MSDDIVDEPFEAASDKVEDSHKHAVAELRARLERAKSEALKKIEP